VAILCGICGIFNYADSGFNIEEKLISAMCGQMSHRGPDDEGIYIDPRMRIGLGHRRLSIIDLSTAGHQPMTNEDQSIWITFNGEIYNHQQIRAELVKKGHRYNSHTDTESIIHLYEEKGEECINDLEGMFAFCIWDSRKNTIFLARDRIGIKPLYYTIKNGLLIFGSEIKVILECPFVSREVNETAIYQYLTFATVPPPATMFAGIYKLPPGNYLVCDKNGNLKQKQYWDAIVETAEESQPEEYYIEQIRTLFSESIEKRMMSDVPFGVFLSGGVDSSLNVALMAELMSRPVDTFTVGFKHKYSYQEFNHAREIAQRFKTNHHEMLISDKDFLDFLPQLAYYQDEPLADPMCVPCYYVAKLAKDNGTTVIQVGEGSDEIFFGYDSFADILKIYQKYWKYFAPQPYLFKKAVYNLLSPWFDTNRKDVIHRAVHNKELFWGGAYIFGEMEKEKLLLPKTINRLNEWDGFDIIDGYYNKVTAQRPNVDLMGKMTYLELKIRLPELLLMRVDKMAMISSVEARVPFLDHKLVEFALHIPPSLKLKNRVGKYILKKAAEGIIPHETIYRKKMGFCGSYRETLSAEFLKYAEHLLTNSNFIKHRFNLDYIKSLFMAHKNQKIDNSLRIWSLFNLVLWYDHWIKEE
jgi:asparagine synthase (glutamine-hydrolysing)